MTRAGGPDEERAMDDAHLIETRIGSEEILNGHFLQVSRDTVGLPDGARTTREYVIHPGAATAVSPTARHWQASCGCKTCCRARGYSNGSLYRADCFTDNHVMKVLDLQCAHQHVFEGWFESEDDFQGQLSRGMVQCPLCGDINIGKKLSAPRLNFGASREPSSPGQDIVAVPDSQAAQAGWLKMVRQVLAHTEDVGDRFAEVARQMHYGETEERGIRGQASREEAVSLLEEGIAVLPLPIPLVLKDPLH